MTPPIISNDDALDRALVQCLRLFAQHGRKIRNQKPPVEDELLDAVKPKKVPKKPRHRRVRRK